MCYMFLILKTICFTGYEDDNTLFLVRDNLKDDIKALEEIGENFVNWLLNNEVKLNTDKRHQLLTLSWRMPVSYRNQSINLRSKSMDWLLYDNGLRHERVK